MWVRDDSGRVEGDGIGALKAHCLLEPELGLEYRYSTSSPRLLTYYQFQDPGAIKPGMKR